MLPCVLKRKPENNRYVTNTPSLSSSSNLKLFVCPIVLGSALPLVSCPVEIALLVHHLHCDSSLEMCLNDYAENAL